MKILHEFPEGWPLLPHFDFSSQGNHKVFATQLPIFLCRKEFVATLYNSLVKVSVISPLTVSPNGALLFVVTFSLDSGGHYATKLPFPQL